MKKIFCSSIVVIAQGQWNGRNICINSTWNCQNEKENWGKYIFFAISWNYIEFIVKLLIIKYLRNLNVNWNLTIILMPNIRYSINMISTYLYSAVIYFIFVKRQRRKIPFWKNYQVIQKRSKVFFYFLTYILLFLLQGPAFTSRRFHW